jgi:ABC-type hemin transport system ATPase subunit
MRAALEIIRLSKRYVAGCGSCLASAQAIRDVDLRVAAGESVAIVGPTGSGKTTLLLCASGLLTADSGAVKWFGDADRAAALGRARLHHHRSSLDEPPRSDESRVHLVDIGDAESARVGAWIAGRCDAGDAVVIGVRDLFLARRLAVRTVALHGGRVVAYGAHACVAEGVFVDRPLRHV